MHIKFQNCYFFIGGFFEAGVPKGRQINWKMLNSLFFDKVAFWGLATLLKMCSSMYFQRILHGFVVF